MVAGIQLPYDQSVHADVPRCVILAAGASMRLRPLTDRMPKCLLKIGGKSLLERTVDNVVAAGIKEIALVVGYRADMIREFVKQRFPRRTIRFFLNPNYANTNNAYSLLLARRFLLGTNEDVNHRLLLLDSDILFSPKLLPSLFSADAENKIAVRRPGEHNVEEVQVGMHPDGNIYFIGKRPTLIPQSSESVGIELFSGQAVEKLFSILEHQVQHGNGRSDFYETAFQKMIDEGIELKAVDIGTLPAMEIDTPEDLDRASTLTIDD